MEKTESREMARVSTVRISDDELHFFRASLKRRLFKALRRAFSQSGMTQQQLADRLGTDPALISKRLNGEANITLNTLSDMTRAMEIELRPEVVAWADLNKRTDDARVQTYSGECADLHADIKRHTTFLAQEQGAWTRALTVKANALRSPCYYANVLHVPKLPAPKTVSLEAVIADLQSSADEITYLHATGYAGNAGIAPDREDVRQEVVAS